MYLSDALWLDTKSNSYNLKEDKIDFIHILREHDKLGPKQRQYGRSVWGTEVAWFMVTGKQSRARMQ